MSLNVHAGLTDDTLKVGVIGCGGRGTGAAIDALYADKRATLVAIGDVFEDRTKSFLENIKLDPKVASQIAITPDSVFSGFDSYKQVIDSDIDVVLLTAPPHFRPLHFAYAVEKNKHCFVEKPIAVDAPGVITVQASCAAAREKRLSVVAGLCYRYDPSVIATVDKVKSGAIGDIVAIESTYNTGTLWHRGDEPSWSRMEYQLRNWLYYTWLSGDHIVEQAVHSLDKSAWLLDDASPISAWGVGGRQQRTDKKYGNIFDHHTVFYEFPNGVNVYFSCRQQSGTSQQVEDTVLGTKGKARLMSHRIEGEQNWSYSGPRPSMYRVEHEELFKGIRSGASVDNGGYMCNSTMIGIMGRMCTYTGQKITWEKICASKDRLGPEVYEWTNIPEPGVAIPGVTKFS